MKRLPHQGLTRLLYACRYSLQGLQAVWKRSPAFRQETLLAIGLIPLACGLSVQMTERVLLIGSVLMVLIVELLNSSIEAVVDRISLEPHILSKRAKDYGSAAVFLALCVCGLTWVCLVGPLIWRGLFD